MEQALALLIARHESLRTSFRTVDGRPTLHTEAQAQLALPVREVVGIPPHELESRLVEAARAPFDLERAPLLRASMWRRDADSWVLLLVTHHIVSDGWSGEILLSELARLYESVSREQAPELPELPVRYVDYAAWQRERLQGDLLAQEIAFWQGCLSGASPILELPADRPRPPVASYRGAVHEGEISSTLAARLASLGRAHGCTLYMTLLAAFYVLLLRYTERDDFLVATPAAGRLRKECEGLIGYFAGTLVLRADLAGDPSFTALLRRVRGSVLEGLSHQELPFERIVDCLDVPRDPACNPLVQVMFSFHNEPKRAVVFAGEESQPRTVWTETAKLDLTLTVRQDDGRLSTAFEYCTDLFEPARIERMAGHYRRLLEGIADEPDASVSRLPLLTDAERHRQLVEWNDTAADFPRDRAVSELFEAQVQRTPDAPALTFGGGTLTYSELNARANRLAHRLIDEGLEREALVGICLDRSPELVVAILSVMKAGGAWVPLEPSYPSERLGFILDDTGLRVVLTESRFIERLPRSRIATLSLDALAEVPPRGPASEDPSLRGLADGLAYVIYTSGSTGVPKGVLCTHRGLTNRLEWQRRFPLGEGDTVLQKTPFSFDVSIWETFWPLVSGARLLLAEPGGHLDPTYLTRAIVEAQVSAVHFVPSMLEAFLRHGDLAACRSLRWVFCSGEALPARLERRFRELSAAELYNLYGPTEAAIEVSAWGCDGSKAEAGSSVPIGSPIANTELLVLDRCAQLVPAGVPGELHIGGVGLARGYLERPGLTAERFIPHPYRPGSERLYRSGDRVRQRLDGVIEFLGRLDDQVKLRGYRIELGEIEAVLLRHPEVSACAVALREDEPGGPRLVGYLVGAADRAPRGEDLREWLLHALPEHMVPAAFVTLGALPTTPSGKIDRQALPAPRPERLGDGEPVAPRNELELVLRQIWLEVLAVDDIGVHDDFFALGGTSLIAVQVVSRVRDELGLELPLVALFQSPTIAGLGQHLDLPGSSGAPARPIEPVARGRFVDVDPQREP